MRDNARNGVHGGTRSISQVHGRNGQAGARSNESACTRYKGARVLGAATHKRGSEARDRMA